ncbi:MAG: DNA transfer protein [Epibacterium sp.]|nr:DNA transfer protein [Epibacterium sp.]NQX73973.1 hypothetical protein [Epibacterium sp.]
MADFNAMGALNAFTAGRAYRNAEEDRQRQQGLQNTQAKAQAALMSGDANAARELAMGSNDAATMQAVQAQLGQMNEQQRQAARERVQGLGAAAYTLAQIPAEQRSQWVMQNGQSLSGLGINPQQIAQMDLSDQNLSAFIRQAEAMQAEFFAPYTLGENEARFTVSGGAQLNPNAALNRGVDQARLAETVRSNRADEGIARQGVAIDQFQADTGRMNAETNRMGEVRQAGDEASQAQEVGRRLQAQFARQDTIFNLIDQAEEQTGPGTTGFFGANLRFVPGTASANLDATLDTIRANIGFEELNQMRAMSPTGGALGQVTERELRFLQSVMGSLEQSQGPEQLRQNLGRIREQLLASRQRVAEAYRQDFGQYPPGYQSQSGTGQAPAADNNDPLGIRG